MFPGFSTDVIEQALQRRQNNVELPLPRVIATYMDK